MGGFARLGGDFVDVMERDVVGGDVMEGDVMKAYALVSCDLIW